MGGGLCAALIPAAALALDLAAGEPPAWAHPVVWMGRAVEWALRGAPRSGRARQLAFGAAVALALPAAFAGAGAALQRALSSRSLIGFAATAALLKTTFAVRALGAAGEAVRAALARGDLARARLALRSLCSRDPSGLDEPALVAATVESLAENASDSVVAPLFYYALGGLPAALAYRAVNTLDAMVGYRGEYEWLGKAAARLDDALNLIPARLTALGLLAAGVLRGDDARAALRVLRRDGRRTESPNAGRPMAAMAGLLGVELEKVGHYRLGDPVRPLAPARISEAWTLACASFAVDAVAGALALFAFHGLVG